MGRPPALPTGVNFRRGRTEVPGAFREVGPVELSLCPRPGRSRERSAGRYRPRGSRPGYETKERRDPPRSRLSGVCLWPLPNFPFSLLLPPPFPSRPVGSRAPRMGVERIQIKGLVGKLGLVPPPLTIAVRFSCVRNPLSIEHHTHVQTLTPTGLHPSLGEWSMLETLTSN